MMCVHVGCMCVCVFVRLCKCFCVSVSVRVLYFSVCLCVHMCTDVRVPVCTCVCVYVYVWVVYTCRVQNTYIVRVHACCCAFPRRACVPHVSAHTNTQSYNPLCMRAETKVLLFLLHFKSFLFHISNLAAA